NPCSLKLACYRYILTASITSLRQFGLRAACSRAGRHAFRPRSRAGREQMIRAIRRIAAAAALIALAVGGPALAQKSGGILRLQHFDSPASVSILEESTGATERPMMGVFNNLVLYDQHVAQNSLQSIVPDLATKWEWSEDGRELTFPLRQRVKWHDGKPFSAA